MQETEIWPYEQVVYKRPRIRPAEWDAKLLGDFEIQMDHLISARRPDLVIVNKKENRLNSGIVRPNRPLRKLKVSEKRDKYRDLARETEKKNYET